MCNMAAYAGTEPAAPKLFRMLQSQETLGGGHYNGIATIHNGKIHMIKVIGSTADLLKRHPEVLDLPGTVGIAHSRTPGIDSDEWAQPFFSYDEKVIYCANGAAGQFTDTDYNKFYLESLANGMTYRTATDEPAVAEVVSMCGGEASVRISLCDDAELYIAAVSFSVES